MSFSALGLSPSLLNAIASCAWQQPGAIQRAAIPVILEAKDVIAVAPTGSGKTAAFCLPLLQGLHKAARPRLPQALILVPTRELAQQVAATLELLIAHLPHPVKLALLYGGVSINPQLLHLRGGADIVIATPGRLLDVVAHNGLQLQTLNTLVLDEADRLLALGFAEELTRILALLPTQRQTLLFSATFATALQSLAQNIMRDPQRIEIAATPVNLPAVQQRAIRVDAGQRTQLLRHLFQSEAWSRVLVFVASQYTAEVVAAKLRKAGIAAEPFHGELSQGKRDQVLADFKAQRIAMVIATDLAARGIDIHELPVVVNYDLPRSPADYTHRIGRTARAGASGMAISLISADSAAHWRLIQRRQDLHIAEEQIAGFETQETAPPPRDINGGIKGKRPSKKDKLRALAR